MHDTRPTEAESRQTRISTIDRFYFEIHSETFMGILWHAEDDGAIRFGHFGSV